MPPDLSPVCLNRFAALLDQAGRVRIPRDALWATFAKAFPNRPQGPEEREWFAGAMEALETQGILRLPSGGGRGWDRSASPPTAMFAQLVRTPVARDGSWRAFPWHHRLSWIADLPFLADGHLEFLQKVHEGLVAGNFREPAPMKYRSLQLTGSEKRLEKLIRTELFRPGRLNLDMLGCFTEILPLAWEQVADAPRLLVFENAGPFAVARMVLRNMKSPPYGMIGFGGGKAFISSVRHLATLDCLVQTISYVGDFDREGLAIPQEAAKIATSIGLPPILPATELHEAMLSSAAALGQPHGWSTGNALTEPKGPDLCQFLDASLHDRIDQVLRLGNRIPEEVLGPEEMRGEWLIRDK